MAIDHVALFVHASTVLQAYKLADLAARGLTVLVENEELWACDREVDAIIRTKEGDPRELLEALTDLCTARMEQEAKEREDHDADDVEEGD